MCQRRLELSSVYLLLTPIPAPSLLSLRALAFYIFLLEAKGFLSNSAIHLHFQKIGSFGYLHFTSGFMPEAKLKSIFNTTPTLIAPCDTAASEHHNGPGVNSEQTACTTLFSRLPALSETQKLMSAFEVQSFWRHGLDTTCLSRRSSTGEPTPLHL